MLPQLANDIRALVDGESQADPKLQPLFQYARIGARAVREGLIAQKGYADAEAPS